MTEVERAELVQRLRQWSRHGQAYFLHDDLKAAAEEIERLVTEIENLRCEIIEANSRE